MYRSIAARLSKNSLISLQASPAMLHCDVLVVGGGPAGSTCAWRLRRAGLDVVVLDKRAFPRDKVCAGWITPAVLDALQLDVSDYADPAAGRVFQPIRGFRVSRLGRREVETRYAEPVSYGVRRFELDDYLLRRCGATLRLDEPLRTLERTDTAWRINGEIEAPMLVGAGGHFCPVARHLGAKAAGKETVVAAQEVEFEMSPGQAAACTIEAEVPQLFFCEDLLGYAWAFRKGDYLNIGIGREDPSRVSDHVQAFVEHLKRLGRIPKDTPDKFHGHAYILYGHEQRNLVGDGVLLIGDSAGLAYPESGEGIRTAIESALMAAETIIHAFAKGAESTSGEATADKNRVTRSNLEGYAARIVERFGPRKASGGLGQYVPASLKVSLAGVLMETEWFTRRVVMDRWFLHRHQAALRV